MKWACEEAAAAGAIAAVKTMETAQEEEEPETSEEIPEGNLPEQAAESAAADVLQRTLKTGRGGIPPGGAFYSGPVQWEVTYGGAYLAVAADCGMAEFRLPFLQETVRVKGSSIVYF